MATLLIKNDGIGDLILASGLIADLGKKLGPVDLVTSAENREIAEAIPGIRHVLTVSRDGIRYRARLLRWGVRVRRMDPEDKATFRELKRTDYDVAICLRRFIRQSSLLLMREVRAGQKHCAWQFPTNLSAGLAQRLTEKWHHYQGEVQPLNELAYYRDFLRSALGLESHTPPRLRGVEPSTTQIEPGLIGLGISGRSTNWPEAHWETLARELLAQGHSLVLFGGPEIAPLASRLAALDRKVFSWIGRPTWRANLEQLQRVALFIGNDTGMTHYASLVVPKCLVLLGGGTFGRFFPWPGAKNQRVLFHGMDCYDCNWICRYAQRECLTRLSPEFVLANAKQWLNDAPFPVPRGIDCSPTPCRFHPGHKFDPNSHTTLPVEVINAP